jgi:hypothetical protein
MSYASDFIDEDDYDLAASLSAKPAPLPEPSHPLLAPLAAAQEILTRLDVLTSCASEDVAHGLRARMAFREASGWLAYSHVWVHHHDLALRSSYITSSYSVAALRGDLTPALPASTARGFHLDGVPDDHLVDLALDLAKLWRRLAELSTWSPLENGSSLYRSLDKPGILGAASPEAVEHWLAGVRARDDATPALLRAGQAAREWANLPGNNTDLSIDAMFMAAAAWKLRGHGRSIPLPFWSAPNQHHHRLSPKTGVSFLAGWLDCVVRAARVGLDELERLQLLEAKAAEITGTKRAKLPAATRFVIRQPVITAGSLAAGLKITPPAASVLVKQMEKLGLIIEVTRRESWRAYVVR